MSAFWSYIRDRLAWGPVQSPGPLQAVAKGMAARLDGARDDSVFLRAQFFPKLCETDLLPDHGASRGLVKFHRETIEQFRSRVVAAYQWHKLAGKTLGLPEILRFYGFAIERIDNVADIQPSRWAEFQIGLTDAAAVSIDLHTLIWLIDEHRPARSLLARMYSPAYDLHPAIWSESVYSDCLYSRFSGVPSTDIGGTDRELLLSFGRRHGVQAPGLKSALALGRERLFATRIFYRSAPFWSLSRYGEAFPRQTGFVGVRERKITTPPVSKPFTMRQTTTTEPIPNRTWRGAWDKKSWSAFAPEEI